MIRLNTFLFFGSILIGFSAQAQSLPPFQSSDINYRTLGLSAFINEISENNKTLQVRKLGVDTANSNIQQAGMPYLSPTITYARGSMYTQVPYTGYTNPSSNTLGAMVTVEGWGKRSARDAQAKADANRLSAEMLAENKSIETEAIFIYIDALRTKLLWQSYQFAISKLDKFQSPLSKQNQAELRAPQKTLANDLQYFSFGLVGYIGKQEKTLPLPEGTLNIMPHKFNVTDIVDQALQKRVDIASNKAAIELASANIDVVKTSKNIDIIPGLYYTETPSYSTGGTSYGSQKSLSLLVSIPLSNSLFYDSDVVGAVNSQAQQEINLESIKTKVAVEINQTYLQYQAAVERLDVASKAYHGARSLGLGSISSILKFREIEAELFDARTAHAKTLILLQRLSGNYAVPNLN